MSDEMYERVNWDTQGQHWSLNRRGAYKVVRTDAIVIERGELPEVEGVNREGQAIIGGFTYALDLEDAQEEALRWLAAVEYLRAHPPVDEAQVEAVAEALYAATQDPTDIDVPDVARRLVQAGVRVEVAP